MVELKPGARVRSAVGAVEVIVVRAPTAPVVLECGGEPMLGAGDEPPAGVALAPERAGPTLIGKRYVLDDVGLELLCTKGGDGELSVGGEPLPLKDAKPLPASD